MKLGNWAHVARIGVAKTLVECRFDVSSDGDIENLSVRDGETDAKPYLCEHQIEDLECECYDSYCKQAKESNDDNRINQFLASAA
jgi:hypothetical protein